MIVRAAAVIPAFNEAGSIATVVEGVRDLVSHVIVVDDGSTDGTAELARAAGAEVLQHDSNRGKGQAIRTGIERVLAGRLDARPAARRGHAASAERGLTPAECGG